jgi:hypothetical protein
MDMKVIYNILFLKLLNWNFLSFRKKTIPDIRNFANKSKSLKKRINNKVIDSWNKKMWENELNSKQVLVMSAQILIEMLHITI